MLEFEVQRCTRRCAATDRELQPGETFYSVLQPAGAEVKRSDYCQESWQGPPTDALGWWKSQMPTPTSKKMHWAPNDVMLHYFEQLENQPDKQDVRYVLTLLMIRRRVLRLEETEQDDEKGEVLVVYCHRNENEYKVTVRPPTEERVNQIQEELTQLLYADAA